MINEKYNADVTGLASAAMDSAQMMITSLRKDRDSLIEELNAVRLEIACLHAKLANESKYAATNKLIADQMTSQHKMQCAMRDEMYSEIQSLKAKLEVVGAGGVGSPVAQWVPVTERLPKPGDAVLLDIGDGLPIRAMWAAKGTLEVGLEQEGDFGEYSEEADRWYCPEGWYEWNQHEETHWAVEKGKSVAWMMLPLPGKATVPAQEDVKDAARWRWIANYLIGNDTSKDDGIVACQTVEQLAMLVDTEIAAQQGDVA